jgi:putative ABC transport system permease protein
MNRKRPDPPCLARKFLVWFLRTDLAEEVQGDLAERFRYMLKHHTRGKAKTDYWIQVIHYLRPFALRKRKYQSQNQYGMLTNYFKIGWRNILKYKAFSAINVFGLSLAMSVCMLIILMWVDQKQYDTFHVYKDRTYRILTSSYATTPYPLASALKTEYAVTEETTNLTPGPGGDAIYGDKLVDMRGYFAEPSFFKIFSFELESGNKATSLSQPNTVVITETIARKLFGAENPLGKVIEFKNRQLSFPLRFDGGGAPPESWGLFTVTGVMDESHYKSHLKFDVLMSGATREALRAKSLLYGDELTWDWYYRSYTYALLQEGKTEADLQMALNDLRTRKYVGSNAEQTRDIEFIPQALGDVQLGLSGNDTNNRLPLIGYYFLIILATIIMLTACVNYTNLSVARALTRAKEIGVRKVNGARRGAIVTQFLSESILTSLLALIMAIGFLYLLTPAFKNLWVNQYLGFELPSTFEGYALFVGFAIFIGVVGGTYPAFYLSNYNPVKVLKSLSNTQRSKLGMRKVLSVSQFVISLFFITTSILVFNQFKHFMKYDYGFKTANIINVELQGADYEKLKNEFSSIAEVTNISATDIIPATGSNNGMEIRKVQTEDAYVRTTVLHTDEHFLDNLGVKIIAGKGLPAGIKSSNEIVISEAALQEFGYKNPADIVGQVFENKWSDEQFEVVGVFQDFTYRLLVNTRESDPIVLRNEAPAFRYLNVRVAGTNMMGTVKKLEEKWTKIDPLHPFRYEFFDEQLAASYQGVFDLVSILGFIAFLAIVISCLGLLGMATYTTERRTKEIGIRKILGAEELSIATLLSKEFLKMLAISIMIGTPLSYLVNNLWLQHLTARVEFGLGTVLSGVVVLLVLGLITIGSQTWRASKSNPINSLKTD